MQTIDLQKIKDSLDPKKPEDIKIMEVYTLLALYMSTTERNEWIKRRAENWGLIENNPDSWWTGEQRDEIRKEKQEADVTNKCVKGVQGKSAIVTDQKPEIKFHPVGSGDLYVAELLKRAHDVVWTKNEGNDVAYDAVEETHIGGIAFIKAWRDPSKGPFGRIINEEAPPEDFYWDRDSRKRDLSDTPILEAKLRSKQYIKEHYPDLTEDDMIFKAELKDETGQKSSGLTGKDNYAEGKRDTPDDQVEHPSEPENIWEIDAYLLKIQHEDWLFSQDEKGQPKTEKIELTKEEKKVKSKAGDKLRGGIYWPRERERRVKRLIVGRKLIDEQENPFGSDADGNPVMPIIALRGQRTRTSYPMSPTDYAKPINKRLNRSILKFDHAISHLANAPIVRPKSGSQWVGKPGQPGSELLVSNTAAFAPSRLQSGAMDATRFLELRKIDEGDINDQYDMHDVMRGKIPEGTDPSGRVVLALQDMGGMMSKPFLRAFESALIRLGKVNMAMVLRYWPRYMWERLLEEDEWTQWMPEEDKAKLDTEEVPEDMKEEIRGKWEDALKKITGEPGISLLDLDVKLTAGSSLPTNRIAKAQLAIEYKGAEIYDAEAALEYIDDPNKDKVIARMRKREEAMLQQGILKPGGRK